MNLIHVNVNVADLGEAVTFYEQFGFEKSWGFETPDKETKHQFIADENGIELQLSENSDGGDFNEGTTWDHLAIGVDDLDDVFKEIDHYGVEQEPKDHPETGIRTAFIYDPDGRKVELVEQ